MLSYDIIIIGAGAAGLMCAIEAGKRKKSVIILDQAQKPAEKVRISGGGRCNFANMHCGPDNFLSNNPHFCKSALKRYNQHDFIALVEQYGIQYHEKNPEKKLGQLFCDGKSQEIIDMLLMECEQADVTIKLETEPDTIEKTDNGFTLSTSKGPYQCETLVIASGGPSIPKMGASNFAYKLARQFGLDIIEPHAGLVPLTFTDDILNLTKELSGTAVDPVVVTCGKTSFREAILFTHRGLSGPAILQISSYWKPGDIITINLAPDTDIFAALKTARTEQPKQMLHTVLTTYLPERLAKIIAETSDPNEKRDEKIADLSDKKLRAIADDINTWSVKPNATEGFRTAEVTCGGIDTNELSSQTFESKKVPGLYFIGECIDVTGHLGGHNFQWAWSSGWACGQVA